MLMERGTAIAHTYDLIKYLVPQLNKFPRNQRFLLADRIQTQVMDILELLIEAYYGSKQARIERLQQVNIALEKLRYQIRLSKDLELINLKRYGYVSEQIDQIGKQVGGWIKYLS